MFKKILIVLTLVAASLFAAQPAKADGLSIGIGINLAPEPCGHYETRYRYESYYVPGRMIGFDAFGQPIMLEGQWVTRTVPYSVWVPCYRPSGSFLFVTPRHHNHYHGHNHYYNGRHRR